MLPIEIRKAVRINFILQEETIPLTPGDNVSFLLRSAKGEFPAIEAKLKEKGVSLPEDFQVQHVMALMAVGAAFELSREMDPNMKQPTMLSEVTLVPDPLNQDVRGRMELISFTTKLGERTFRGSLYHPDHPFEDKMINGFPWFISTPIEKGTKGLVLGDFVKAKSVKIIKDGQLVTEVGESRLSSRGINVVNFLALQIPSLR